MPKTKKISKYHYPTTDEIEVQVLWLKMHNPDNDTFDFMSDYGVWSIVSRPKMNVICTWAVGEDKVVGVARTVSNAVLSCVQGYYKIVKAYNKKYLKGIQC